MNKIIVIAAVGIAVIAGGAQYLSGTTILDCSAAGSSDVYDTPSGKLEPGYYDPVYNIGTPMNATTGKPSIIATVIGRRHVQFCTDPVEKKQYEYPITEVQLTTFKESGDLPPKTI